MTLKRISTSLQTRQRSKKKAQSLVGLLEPIRVSGLISSVYKEEK